MKESYFFLFTIGPVQSFIEEARKTQDLFGGSALLSALMKKLHVFFIKKLPSKIIFPSLPEEALEANHISITNRILVKITVSDLKEFRATQNAHKNDHDLEVLASFLSESVRMELRNQGTTQIDKIPKKEHKNWETFEKAFYKQLANHLEIYWAAYPIMEEDDYSNAFTKVHQYLATAKNSRNYPQWEEQGRKCSLDGIRNALICRKYKELSGRERSPAYLNDEVIFLNHKFLIEREGLSALSFIKRRFEYQRSNSFDSTTEIALMNTLDRLLKGSPEKEFTEKQELKNAIDRIRSINAQFFYEENTQTDSFEKIQKDEQSAATRESIIQDQKLIQKAASAQYLPLNKYYALIHFDGDNMGKWWGGNKELLITTADLEGYHDKLAIALADYAKEAKLILEEKEGKRGRLVYAGGDDFLGFINLEFLLPVLLELRTAFDDIINKKIKAYLKTDKGMSFSAGVQIAHYKEPLRLVVNAVKKAEKKAKEWNHNKKDNCCLSILRASGTQSTCLFPFFDKEGEAVLPRVMGLMELLARYFAGRTADKLELSLKNFSFEKKLMDAELSLIEAKIWNTLARSCILPPSSEKYFRKVNVCFNECMYFARNYPFKDFLTLLVNIDFIIRHTQFQYLQNIAHADLTT